MNTRYLPGALIRDGTFARRGDALGPKGGLMFNGQSVEEEGGSIGPRLVLRAAFRSQSAWAGFDSKVHAAAAVPLRRKRMGTRKHRASCKSSHS
jgi:hypothetical protein